LGINETAVAVVFTLAYTKHHCDYLIKCVLLQGRRETPCSMRQLLEYDAYEQLNMDDCVEYMWFQILGVANVFMKPEGGCRRRVSVLRLLFIHL
jgi:hypothetical protein